MTIAMNRIPIRIVLMTGFAAIGFSAGTPRSEAEDWKPVRIGSGVSGHIHPSACVTKQGTVIVSYCKSEAKDLLISRSTNGGRTWSEPAESPVT